MYRLIFLLFLFPGVVQALNLYDLNGQCGNHVRVILRPMYDTPMSTGINDRGEYINVDPDFLRTYSDDAVWFVFFHECGHRVNHHSREFKPPNRELIADCYAAKRFYKNFGYDRLTEALKDLGNIQYPSRNKRILECISR